MPSQHREWLSTEFYYFAIQLENEFTFKKNSALMNDEQRTQTIPFALRSSFRLFAIIFRSFFVLSLFFFLFLSGCSSSIYTRTVYSNWH